MSIGLHWTHPLAAAAASPWLETLGRFHVVVAHFPIALLLVAAAIELVRLRKRPFAASRVAVICLILGTLAASLTALTGWYHGQFSSFGDETRRTFQTHQWLGIATAIVALIALVPLAFTRLHKPRNWAIRGYQLTLILCALLVAVSAHLGGALTHGSGYLTELVFAPASHDPPPSVQTVSAVQSKPIIRDISSVHFPADGKIVFERDVEPILASACYECHGPSKRKGALRLDNKSIALKGGNTGPAVVAHAPDKSQLIRRVLGRDNKKRMPLEAPPLSDEHVRILTTWIEQGATWPNSASRDGGVEEKHWAFVAPKRPEVPVVKNSGWPRNPIDNFVLAKMEAEGLEPSPEADRATLIRRLSLDLTGLPPTPAEVDGFINDDRPDAYEQLVNRLLASPHYGERWGRHWLDVARYADTNGYEKDLPRSIWPYRDWVMAALNRDMSFDQFVVEQLAGDLLPGADADEKIATGFHRNSMLNEEGGIDVEEFRFKSIVDRMQTTGQAFLGLTVQCAQCHNHKYDPVSQKEYYQLFAFFNNVDEPQMEVPDESITKKRRDIQQKIDKAEAELENQFPTREEPPLVYDVLHFEKMTAASGAALTPLPDGSILASGPVKETESFTLETTANLRDVVGFRIDALPDPLLPKLGPGRANNGNFVLSELKVTRTTPLGDPLPVPLANATAEFSQKDFPAANAIDGKPDTGWAIANAGGDTNVARTLDVRVKNEPMPAGTATLAFTLDQNFSKHPIGRFRISAARRQSVPPSTQPAEQQRSQFLAAKLAEWEAQFGKNCSHWTVLEPVEFRRKHDATITRLPDNSLLFTGDSFYRDEYQLEYATTLTGITAIKVEVLPDARLTKGGPGRNTGGGFFLSELTLGATPGGELGPPLPLTLENPTADAGEAVGNAIDGKVDSHWKVSGGDGVGKTAVFQLKGAPGYEGGTRLAIDILQNYFDAESLGRIRVSASADPTPKAAGVPAEIEQILLVARDQRTPEQSDKLKRYFLKTTPLLATQQAQIAALRASMPAYATTLVMQERAKPRVTRFHHRGEYLQEREFVEPNVPAILPPLPKDAPENRLTLARWIASPENPLLARVTMNRIWSRYFGRGIVATTDDFGTVGEKPSHPELLDWLATEFIRRDWSLKQMHRLIVTSSTYRQSSRVTPQLQEKDPANLLLARAPRLRVEGEIVRDIALSASGLLNDKIGGPSVYPPQPPDVSERAYFAFPWPTSDGPDRYRRGMYTFFKRSTPYPMLMTFDSPSSENTCTRRIRSNTPLQALTTLNDTVYVEAAQAMARRVMTEMPSDSCDATARAQYALRLCVGRPAEVFEVQKLVAFHDAQLARFRDKKGDAMQVAIAANQPAPSDLDVNDLAAWTLTCRAVMNLDETITKE
jgi:uncharacterized membrane protein